MDDQHFVYIIYSPSIDRYYIGQCKNLLHRLRQHNDLELNQNWTKRGIPWELCLKIACITQHQAMKLEHFIKKMKSRKFLQRLIIDKGLQDSLKSRYKSG